MVTGLELGVLALALVFVLVATQLLSALHPLLVNAVVGLLALLVASTVGIEVAVDWVALLVIALGGLLGAALVLLLSLLGVAFVPGVLDVSLWLPV